MSFLSNIFRIKTFNDVANELIQGIRDGNIVLHEEYILRKHIVDSFERILLGSLGYSSIIKHTSLFEKEVTIVLIQLCIAQINLEDKMTFTYKPHLARLAKQLKNMELINDYNEEVNGQNHLITISLKYLPGNPETPAINIFRQDYRPNKRIIKDLLHLRHKIQKQTTEEHHRINIDHTNIYFPEDLTVQNNIDIDFKLHHKLSD